MSSEDESGDAIFMVQPEEMGCYKSLRRVVDQVFTTTGRFLPSSMIYAPMESAEEGVNRHLRAMLFIPSKRTKRGVRRVGVGKELDGNVSGLSATKQTQRQSKQKERCENRLLSLLFATIYDPATKRCRLVQDAPPLKLQKVDKNGQVRNVSNYTDVRLFLRNSMASILSTYSESVKTLNQILPDHFGILPSLFVIIARAFMAIAKVDASESNTRDPSQLRAMANQSLGYCMKSIQEFITTWERRNFSTDNPLLHCLQAGENNEQYRCIQKLLQTMINILPPTGLEPYAEHFRSHEIHIYGSPSGSVCEDKQCILGSKCPGRRKKTSQVTNMNDYLEFIAALSECAKLSPSFEFDEIDRSIGDQGFSTATWRCNEGLCLLHRMETFSSIIQNQRLHTRKMKNINASTYLEGVYWDIARYWSAIGRSNHMTWQVLNKLRISDSELLKKTAIELIFGGAIASITLFERENDIIPICARLRSKKGPMVVNTKKFTSDADTADDSVHIAPSLGPPKIDDLQPPDVDAQTDTSVPSNDEVQTASPKHLDQPSSTHELNNIKASRTQREKGRQAIPSTHGRNDRTASKPSPNKRKRFRQIEQDATKHSKEDKFAMTQKPKRVRKSIA